MLLSVTMPKENKLFDLQDYLPKLPLPTLEDTCRRYEPLQLEER